MKFRMISGPVLASAVLLAGVCAVSVASAQEQGVQPAEEEVAELVVEGERTGPGLWRVTRGSHVLWIVSSVDPTRKRMKWRTRELEQVIAESKLVVGNVRVKSNMGFFRGVWLLPSLLRARLNPDGAVLKDMVPPAFYVRWIPFRQTYFKNDADVEKMRPTLLALMMYSEAMEKAGLVGGQVIARTVEGLAKKHRVPMESAKLKVKLENPRGLIQAIPQIPRETELACLRGAMDHLDAEVELMIQRANAWAVGDVEAFRQLPKPEHYNACIKALKSSEELQELIAATTERVGATFFDSLESALIEHDSSVALLPLDQLISEEGLLAKFRAKGYTVENPRT